MPVYWMVITFLIPATVYPFSSDNDKIPTDQDKHTLVHVLIEVFIIISSAMSAAIFLFFSSLFKESFLQEEWLHAQLFEFNNLG